MSVDPLQMGKRSGGRADLTYSFPVGASEVFKKKGGGFVIEDASGRVEIATAAATNIIGAALLFEDLTASATEGGTTVQVDLDLSGIYELPVSGTYLATMRGKTCDIIITSNVQYANVAATAIDILEIVDAGFTNAAGTITTVLVKLFQKNLTRTGV